MTTKFDLSAYLLILPAALVTLALTFYPLGYAINLTFYDVDTVRVGSFVGLDNYDIVLGNDRIQENIANSFVFTFGSMFGVLVVGMTLALMLSEELRFRTGFRTLMLVPWVVTEVVSMLLIKWILNYDFGLLNIGLQSIGLGRIDFLGTPSLAMASLVFANIWRSAAFSMVILLAGIQNIPSSIFEAARLEGAGLLRRVFSIILPMIKSSLLVVAVVTTISYFNRVTPILVLTEGGPVTATETLGLRMYVEAFFNFRMSEAAVIGMVIFAINLVLIALYLRVLRSQKYY